MQAEEALRQIKGIIAQLENDQCDELLRLMSPKRMRDPGFARLGIGLAFWVHLQKRRGARKTTREWMTRIHALRKEGKKHSVIFATLSKEDGFPFSSQQTMESKLSRYKKQNPEWFPN